MARRERDFQPDAVHSDTIGKLLMTRKQWQRFLKWLLFSVVCLLGLIVQDVVMSRFRWYGATTDLAVCCILTVCVLQGAESGCIFALVASVVFFYSGSAPGPYCIPLLTCIAVFATLFRQGFLSQGLTTLLICVGAGLIVYELAVFLIGVLLDHTTWDRWTRFLLCGVYTSLAVPVLYPMMKGIGKIGGQLWTE